MVDYGNIDNINVLYITYVHNVRIIVIKIISNGFICSGFEIERILECIIYYFVLFLYLLYFFILYFYTQ